MNIAKAKNEKELQANVLQLRKYCSEYEKEYDVEYDEASRKAALMTMCPEKLEDELIAKGNDKDGLEFEEVTSKIG